MRWYDYVGFVYSIFKDCDSGKFPELVWLVVNCRQTIFSFLGQFRVPIEEPPARYNIK